MKHEEIYIWSTSKRRGLTCWDIAAGVTTIAGAGLRHFETLVLRFVVLEVCLHALDHTVAFGHM